MIRLNRGEFGLGRPLRAVPKADGEVARVVILQEQPEDAPRSSRRIVRYVSSLRHPPAPPPVLTETDPANKTKGIPSSIYLKHRAICDKLLFKK